MVELRGVTKQFGSNVVVKSVDLQIRAGEFLTMLGPSGCGKTTMLRMISGFDFPTQGQVLLDDIDVTREPPYRRNVNQVFQSYALFPHLNVIDNIRFGLRLQNLSRPEIKERSQRAVEMVSLQGFENRRPSQLSGGQRQRVALARAIVCRPKVLLLDEPLAALDAKLRKMMQIELKTLQSKLGITFIFVTHDQEEALTMSDRIAVVNQGKIEQLGSVDEIYHRPRTSFVANFIGQANLFDCRVIERDEITAKVELAPGVQLSVDAKSIPSDARTTLISIRPEKIHIQKSADGSENAFPATIKVELFKGAVDQLILATDSGLELSAVVANLGAMHHSFHKDDRVYCQIHRNDIVVVQANA